MKTSAAILVAAFVWVLAGCNTINGIGKDVEWAGQKVQGASR